MDYIMHDATIQVTNLNISLLMKNDFEMKTI